MSCRRAMLRVATGASAVLLAGANAIAQTPDMQSTATASMSEAASAAQVRVVVQDAIRRVSPAIVRIETVGGASAGGGDEDRGPVFRQADGPTTGVIWDSAGWIITSSFNFLRDPSIITVTLSDGRRLVARLVARDAPLRLALLRVDAANLPAPSWGPRGDLRVGQRVMAAGFGFGSREPAVSLGVLSAIDRMNGVALQSDAKTSPANYGGPLFDLDGRVLGVCVPMGAGEDEAAGVDWYDSGIGFAVAVDVMRTRLPRLMRGESLHRGVIGVFIESRDPVIGMENAPTASMPAGLPQTIPLDGLLVTQPPRGPAADAGMRQGDVITAIDGQAATRLIHFRRIVARKAAGDSLKLEWRRGTQKFDAEMKLVSLEQLRATSQPASDSQPTSSAPAAP